MEGNEPVSILTKDFIEKISLDNVEKKNSNTTTSVGDEGMTRNHLDSSSSLCKNGICDAYKHGPLIICDAWYGFPTQKRPRKERILAVSKQIYNFLHWRLDFYKLRQDKLLEDASHILVIGKEEDVGAIRDRVDELCQCHGKELLVKCTFLPGMTLEEIILSKGDDSLVCCETGRKMNGITSSTRSPSESKENIVYLSPDAEESLKPTIAPPTVVVVGMLVDRKVQPNRSKLRAQELILDTARGDGDAFTIESRSLPLDSLNVVELNDDEPLNIDTVMEMMERWWGNVRNWNETKNGDSLSKSFRDAASRALYTHRSRHPNRTVHGGVSSTIMK